MSGLSHQQQEWNEENEGFNFPFDKPQQQLLRIRIEVTDLPLRDLARYLSFVDRIYGRLSSPSLLSYSKAPSQHVQVASAMPGSIELVIQEALGSGVWLFALYFALKHLPEFARAYAEAYRNVQEGKLAKARADEIQHRLIAAKSATRFKEPLPGDLASEILRAYSAEARELKAVAMFTEDHVILIKYLPE